MAQVEPTGGGRKRLLVLLVVGLVGLLVLGLLAMGSVFLIPRRLGSSAPPPTVRVARTPTRAIALATIAPTATSEPTEAPTPTLVNASGMASPTPEVIGTPASGQLPQSGEGEDLATSARITFDYPTSMSVDRSEIVTVQIRTNALVAAVELFPGLEPDIIENQTSRSAGSRKTIGEDILAFRFIHASLLAPDFDVFPNEAKGWQPLTEENVAVWSWYLAAKKPGPSGITLDVFGLNNEDDKYWVLIKEYRVDVSVSDKPALERLLTFLGANPTFIISLMGGGGVISLMVERAFKSLTERRKKRKSKQQE